MTQAKKEPTAPFNPLYGCAIMLVALVTFGSMIAWTLYSGYKQDQEIGTFTVESAPPLPVPEVTDAQRQALLTKLDSFDDASANQKPVTLILSLDELHTLLVLAGERGIVDYRGTVRITGIDGPNKLILADLCWELNRLPFSKGAKRFLVGQSGFKFVIEKNSLDLHIETLAVPGKTVSPGFLGHLQSIPWLALAKNHATVSGALARITSFDVSPDGSAVILEAAAPAAPNGATTKSTP